MKTRPVLLVLLCACLALLLDRGASKADSGFTATYPTGYATPAQAPSLALWLRADQGVTFGAMAVPVHFAGTGTTVVGSGDEFLVSDGAIDFGLYATTSGELNLFSGPGQVSQTQTTPFLMSAVSNGASTRIPATAPVKGSCSQGIASSGLYIGGPTVDFWKGQIPEIAVDAVAESYSVSAQMAGYFANRYGL